MRVGDSSRRCEEIVKKSRTAPLNAIIIIIIIMGLQDFNDDAVIQRLELPVGEKLMGACHRTFPFYWHDKQEEQQRLRLRQGTLLEQPSMETVAMDPQAFDIPVTTHTVLDGCIVVTDSAVYECRPR